MKNELKISTLSIVCVLCAAFSAPVSAAPAVRALGGVGTYSSASNAASAKASGATAGAINSVRGGTVRVGSSSANNKADGVSASTARTSAVPRLSIGKYLAGSATLGGAVSGQTKPGQASGNLQQRIEILEQHLGYKGDGSFSQDGRIEKLELDFETLSADVKKLTAGTVSDVEYAGGVLAVYKMVDGKEVKIEYDLNTEFAGVSELIALEEKINQIVLGNYVTRDELAGYALKTDLTSAVAQLQATDVQLQAAIDVLAGSNDFADIAALNELSARVDGLVAADAVTAADILALQTTVAALENQANSFVTKDVLQKIESSLSAFLTVDDLANYYTKDEVNVLIEGAGNFNPELYYNKEETNATFATKAELKATDDIAKEARNAANNNGASIVELERQMAEITDGGALGALAYKDTVATADIDNAAVTPEKINTTSLGAGGMAIVQNTASGTKLVPIIIVDENGNDIL